MKYCLKQQWKKVNSNCTSYLGSSNTTRFVFFNKICLFQQDLSFSTRFVFFNNDFQQILSFSTNLVVFNKYCLFQHAVKNKSCRKRQDLSLKKQILLKKTSLVEKDKICQKRQILSC